MRSITEGLDKESKGPSEESGGGGWRDSFNQVASGPLALVALLVVALLMVWFVFNQFQAATGPAEGTVLEARVRMMDPLTGEMMWYRVAIGKTAPEGFYPVEYCWNEHPDALAVPTVLNTQLFEPGDPRRDEPTICPCGDKVVVGRNPRPERFFGLTPEDYETGEAPACVVEHYRAVLGN